MNKGISLVEILVAIGVFSTVIFAVVGVFTVTQEAARIGRAKAEGIRFLNEYIEQLKNIRRDNWDALLNDTYIIQNDGSGNLLLIPSATGETVGDYTRLLTIAAVYRDTNGNLVDTPGMIDPSTKKITVSVSWTGFKPGSLTHSTYMTRYLDNLVWVQTTEADFTSGTHSGTVTVNTSGGEVVLGAGGSGSWCEPGDAILDEFDYPGSAIARAITAIEGRAFAGTGQNASGLPFAHINISDPLNAFIVGEFSDVSPPKSNDVFGEENYAYIATEENNGEIIIIDLTTTPYSEEGRFNPSGNNRGISVFVAGNVGYMTTSSGNTFRTFNLTGKSGVRPQYGQVTLAGTGNSIFVRGDYAYVTINSSSTQLQILDVSDPENLSIVSSLSLTNVGGRDVYVNETGTRAYAVMAYSSSNPEFFIVDITDKGNPQLISGGTYDTGSMSPTGIRVVPGGRAILVGESGGERYQVLNISNESAPVHCGGLNVTTDIYGVDAVLEGDGDAYSYIVTADSNAEFKIIEGGPGGAFATSGVFESQTFSPGFNTAFNRFDVTVNTPVQTSIRFQIASVEPGSNGCVDADFSPFNFVGPDGTSASFFTTGDTIPTNDDGTGYENPAECFRFRSYLETTETTQTPTLYDFTVNYSP
ncbi:hypothetical protein HY468_05020 [Candidatus Roizmanbacteria bacterium]|nr:hypothetical protein [Candidatus Roizmanbacteria bacterium]